MPYRLTASKRLPRKMAWRKIKAGPICVTASAKKRFSPPSHPERVANPVAKCRAPNIFVWRKDGAVTSLYCLQALFAYLIDASLNLTINFKISKLLLLLIVSFSHTSPYLKYSAKLEMAKNGFITCHQRPATVCFAGHIYIPLGRCLFP